MKTLHTDGNLTLAIMDNDNYVVYDHTKPKINIDPKTGRKTTSFKYSYHNRIDSAIREVSRLRANEEGYDLPTWLESYARALETAGVTQHA